MELSRFGKIYKINQLFYNMEIKFKILNFLIKILSQQFLMMDFYAFGISEHRNYAWNIKLVIKMFIVTQ